MVKALRIPINTCKKDGNKIAIWHIRTVTYFRQESSDPKICGQKMMRNGYLHSLKASGQKIIIYKGENSDYTIKKKKKPADSTLSK